MEKESISEDAGRPCRYTGKDYGVNLRLSSLNWEDTIICWFKRRIQPLQHRARLLCEYTDNADPMQTSEEDLDEELFQARLNQLIKARPNESRQYEESLPMFTAANPPPKVLCRFQRSIPQGIRLYA